MATTTAPERIVIFRGSDTWLARFSDPETVGLFTVPGRKVPEYVDLPTPWGLRAAGVDVLRDMSSRHPGVRVVLVERAP